MRIFRLFPLVLALSSIWSPVFAQINPHPKLPGQKGCEQRHIKLTMSYEVNEGLAYKRLSNVANLFDIPVPHLFIVPKDEGETEYLTGSIFTDEPNHKDPRRGKIFLSETDLKTYGDRSELETIMIDEYGEPSALEGLLGEQVAYLVADANSGGNRPCEPFNLRKRNDSEEMHADIEAARHIRPEPIIALLRRIRDAAMKADHPDVSAIKTIDTRRQDMGDMELLPTPPDPQQP